jgi:predicted DNA-binding transcriptional regulator AlpA
MSEQDEVLLTALAAATLLGLTEPAFRQRLHRADKGENVKVPPRIRFGKSIRFRKSDVMALIRPVEEPA